MITLTLAAVLGADAEVAALVGTAITQNRLDDKFPPKAIVLQLIGEQEAQTLSSGPASVRWARVQVDAWATRVMDAVAIASAVYDVLSPLRGVQADGTSICGITRDSKQSRYDPETKLSGVSADYLIWFSE